MNLRIFFDPIKDLDQILFESSSLFHHVQIYSENFPNWQEADIALIGLTEERGTVSNLGLSKAPNEIRKKLYHLKKGSSVPKVVDLGNLRCGISLEESYLRLKEICECLIQKNVIPFIIGGTHDMDLGQFLAFETTGKLINLLNVDSSIDMYGSDTFGVTRNHIHKILTNDQNIIFHYSHLGYQSYLVEPEVIGILEKLHFETYRLGHVKEHFREMEPVIRNADMLTFDISAIKVGDAPGNKNGQPFGFTGEEACQLFWYAGLSSRMESVGIYEYNPEEDIKEKTAGVIATMIWYFFEGFTLRTAKLDFNDARYIKFIVSLQADPHSIIFYKDSRTEKWWMEVPYPNEKVKYANNYIVPCSYEDYMQANKGEIPNRWILTHAKLI